MQNLDVKEFEIMERVKFNVSGTMIETTKHTLQTFGFETTLGELSQKDVTEVIFLDRDPNLFRHILNCMRHHRIFTASQVGVPQKLWNLELAYFGLVVEKKTKEKPKKRPLDIVEGMMKEKRANLEQERERIEAIFMWFLSQPPGRKFQFLNFDRNIKQNTQNLPDAVWTTDADYIRQNEDLISSIGRDNKIHVRFEDTIMSIKPYGV